MFIAPCTLPLDNLDAIVSRAAADDSAFEEFMEIYERRREDRFWAKFDRDQIANPVPIDEPAPF